MHSSLYARRHGQNNIHAACFGLDRGYVADGRAIAALSDLARVQHIHLVQRIVPVLIIAVGELGGFRSLLHHHALGHVLVVERGGRDRTRDTRNRESHNRLAPLPHERRCTCFIGAVLDKRAWVGARRSGRPYASDRGLRRTLGTGPQSNEPLLNGAWHRIRLSLPWND